jgi:predicted AlkP superfamily phosphohydrolase/phosphomutase
MIARIRGAGLQSCGSRRTIVRRGAALLLGAMLLTPACSHHRTLGRRVIVLGFDGLDFGLTKDLMARGRLPHFARLAARGSFSALATTIPPQSPVAWSSFITGLDPGGHGIFDFVHRDPKTMAPYLSTTRTKPPSHFLSIGRWQFPLAGGRVELLRRGTPFWETLEHEGIETTIVRMPANFPPSASATRELSGMGTPDLLGTYGTFSYYTTDPFVRGGSIAGGTVYQVELRRGLVRAVLEGPDDPLVKQPQKARLEFEVHVDPTRAFAKLVAGDEERLLKVGEWSDWVPVRLPLAWGHLAAQCRFYLKQLDPEFILYASPLNIDPLAPALPISTPHSYAADLARATGRFYTQGMPEDTKALKTGLLTPGEFLTQSRLAGDEVIRQYRDVLGRVPDGLLFYYFGNVDQVSHMLWRPMDPGHPAYDPIKDPPYRSVIEDLYVQMDKVVGETVARLGPDDLLVVMSDHGFASWRRAFNLNTWLRDHGYLRLRSGRNPARAASFEDIDWSGTRAYGLGLNGLYLNVRGREASGIVEPADREALAREIADALLREIDPKTGERAITRVFPREQAYHMTDADTIAPDLIVGYAKGTRTSDESAVGGIPPAVITDNRSAWTGDHCMDPDSVPGILLTSRRLQTPAASLRDLAPALLAELGVTGFPKAN